MPQLPGHVESIEAVSSAVVAAPAADGARSDLAVKRAGDAIPLAPPVPHSIPHRCLVVVPTYNERANVGPIVDSIRQWLDADVLIVDDESPDGTGAESDRIAVNDRRVRVLHRPAKMGLGSAYVQGFRVAIRERYGRVFEMDADFSHSPWDLPRLAHASLNAQLVIGSRYVPGGSTAGLSLHRRLLSRGGNVYAGLFLGSAVRDWTAGFRCFDVDALSRIDLDGIASQGYAFQIEMAWRFLRAGMSVVEVPIRFSDRAVGDSKMTFAIAREAAGLVPALRLRGRRTARRS
ncbi:MAG: polyprenol monophosphomannose synthase [Acidobacteriota bacterium]|nr:polyprenol monophosphomannose synthase [Acidobacteriota bacterium]